MRRFLESFGHLVVGSAVAFVLTLLVVYAASAQTAPTVTLTASPTSGVESATPTLTWSSTGATSCVASGGWSGTKATSGTQTLPAITTSTTYSLTCNAAGGFALLSWTPPTQRTNGTALTNLAGYRIKYGTQSGTYTTTLPLNTPAATTYTVNNLPPATYFFVMTAVDADGLESANSNQGSKVVTVPAASASVPVTINFLPRPPSNFVVSQLVALEVQMHPSQGPRLVTVGEFELGLVCGPQYFGNFYEMDPTQATRLQGRYKGGLLLAVCERA